MKILVVTPPYHGKNTGTAEHDIIAAIKLMQEMGHEVRVVVLHPTYYETERAKTMLSPIPALPISPKETGMVSWILDALTSSALFDRAAYSFELMTRDKSFREFFDAHNPDLVISWCSYSWPALRFASKKGKMTIFRSHNYEPSFFFEALEPLQKWSPLNWIRRGAKSLGERAAAKWGSVVGSIPFEQASLYKKWKDPRSVFILTLTNVGEKLKAPFVHQGKKPLDVFYLGANYRVSFHLRGVEILINQIVPMVHKEKPGAFRFHICGAKLPETLQKKCDGVHTIYEGYVDDFEEFMGRMDIGAFPVETGKSMKGKVFETICRAFPVVISPNCLGGYDLRNGENALIAENPTTFANAILSLEDDTLRQKLSEGAAAFGIKEFSTDSIRARLEEIINRAVTLHQ